MRRRSFERVHDLIKVPLRIGLRDWVPNIFIAENTLAVLDGCHLAVAGAQIKSDPTTLPVPAQGHGTSALRRQFLCLDGNHVKWALIDPVTHQVRVELARRCLPKMVMQPFPDLVGAAQVNPKTAARR